MFKNIIKKIITEEYSRREYLSWKRKNVTIRGVKESGKENNAGAMLGRGLYTAFLSNKELAKQYGKVYFVLGAKPKKPKVFNTLNEWEIFEYNTLITNYFKNKGEKTDKRTFFNETTIEDEMMKLGYDGIVIKGREMVNFKPNKSEIIYFQNERELESYFSVL